MSFKNIDTGKPPKMDMVTYAWTIIDDLEEERLCRDLLDNKAISYSQAATVVSDMSGTTITPQAMRHWHVVKA